MDLETITVEDFKTLFSRDFLYLPVYDDEKLYNQGARVYYPDTELFYDCLSNGTEDQDPTDLDYWILATDDILNYIGDTDIEKAFSEAKVTFNQGMWGSDEEIELAYLYLTAFFLVNDIKAALGGIQGTANFPVNSRAVGNVSESYSIPQLYLDDPTLGAYMANAYGAKYLTMAIPRLRGNVVAVCGATRP
jgi:hypothetical protein